MFKKILEMSKKEYEMCVNKQNEKNKENNNNNNSNNNNNKEVNPNIKPIETDMIIFPPPDDDKVNNGDK